jgi:hypothetical protein
MTKGDHMRYALLLVALSLGVVVATTSRPAASAPSPKVKTVKVNWSEKKAFEGGHMAFRVTRLVVRGAKWTVTASITNRSTEAVSMDSITYPTRKLAGMSLAYPVPPQGGYGYNALPGTNVLPMRFAQPRFPTRLGPGQSWTGTFGAYAVLPKKKQLWVIFGWFTPEGRQEEGFNHVTTHAFRL